MPRLDTCMYAIILYAMSFCAILCSAMALKGHVFTLWRMGHISKD